MSRKSVVVQFGVKNDSGKLTNMELKLEVLEYNIDDLYDKLKKLCKTYSITRPQETLEVKQTVEINPNASC